MDALYPFRKRSNSRHFAGAALLGCLLLRTLIPLGYMPGNLLAGEFVTLCPQGLPAQAAHQLHESHGGSSADTIDTDSICPLGNALSSAAPPPSPQALTSLPRSANDFSVTLVARPESSLVLHYASRAPPHSGVNKTT